MLQKILKQVRNSKPHKFNFSMSWICELPKNEPGSFSRSRLYEKYQNFTLQGLNKEGNKYLTFGLMLNVSNSQ